MFAGLTCRSATALALCATLAAPLPAHAALLWSFSYTAPGIDAAGTLTTGDVADAQGFFQITGITGLRNGIAITGLQAAGTPIPGNEGFPVDDLISASGQQLTGSGFGFATADGNFANPFFADFLNPTTYLEFFSAPPFTPGVIGPEDSELPVSFSAQIPEPGSMAIMVMGLAGLVVSRRRQG